MNFKTKNLKLSSKIQNPDSSMIRIEKQAVKYIQNGIACPDCGSRLIPASGCAFCPACGWSRCS